MILSDNQYPIYPAIVFLNTSSIRLTGDGDCVLHKNKLRSYISKYRNILMSIEDCKKNCQLPVKSQYNRQKGEESTYSLCKTICKKERNHGR